MRGACAVAVRVTSRANVAFARSVYLSTSELRAARIDPSGERLLDAARSVTQAAEAYEREQIETVTP